MKEKKDVKNVEKSKKEERPPSSKANEKEKKDVKNVEKSKKEQLPPSSKANAKEKKDVKNVEKSKKEQLPPSSKTNEKKKQDKNEEPSQSKPKGESKNDSKPKCFCDPTPEAYRVAAEKARLRGRDTNDPTYKLRQEEYIRHLRALDNVKADTDHFSPLVPKAIMHGLQRHNKSTMIHGKIEVANAKLLQKLASIYNGSISTGLDNKLTVFNKSRHNRTVERTYKAMELVYENIKKYEWIKLTKPFYSNKKTRKWYEEQRKHRDRISKYPSIDKPKACPLMYRKIMKKAVDNPRQYAYLLVEIEDLRAENIVIELFADVCPFTVRNFQRLCTNTKATACDCRTYRCKKIDRLHSVQVLDGSFRKMYWVIGEHVDSAVEYTAMMIQESSPFSHTEAGLVSRPKGRAGGVFYITSGSCTHLDEFCYVFGKVKSGFDFLQSLQEKNVEENGTPVINMHVTDCGVVDKPDKVPPPMLLQDFISQVRLEIMPFLKRNPERPQEWIGGKTAFADHLREKINEDLPHFDDAKKEADELAAEFPPGSNHAEKSAFAKAKKKGNKAKKK